MDKMTPKQQAFVNEYLIDLNATQAAIRAGYSVKTAEVIANQLIKKTLVRAAINKAQCQRADKAELNAEWVLNRLQRIADVCMKEDERGRIDSAGAAKATELIGKHLAMFTEKKEIDIGERTSQLLTVYNLPLKQKLAMIAEIDNELDEDEG